MFARVGKLAKKLGLSLPIQEDVVAARAVWLRAFEMEHILRIAPTLTYGVVKLNNLY
jgi:hypothetical protein